MGKTTLVNYIASGAFDYTRDGTSTTLFVETDGSGPDVGTPNFNNDPAFFPADLPDNGDAGFEVGDDMTGLGNLFEGYLTLDVNGVPTDFLLLTGASGGVSDPNTFLLLMPQGTDLTAAQAAIPRTFNTDSDLTQATYFCFAKGTLIATTAGPVPVEDVTRDHRVITADGRAVAVAFVGQQRIATRFSAAPGPLVEIAQGALGDGVPVRDLRITGDHAVLIDGCLINASALVNGTSVRYVPKAALDDVITVYHIETDAHEALLAEGAACESFIDYQARARLDNHAEFLALFGDDRVIAEMALPRIASARLVPQQIRARIAGACRPTANVA